jgi:hypothetical protein
MTHKPRFSYMKMSTVGACRVVREASGDDLRECADVVELMEERSQCQEMKPIDCDTEKTSTQNSPPWPRGTEKTSTPPNLIYCVMANGRLLELFSRQSRALAYIDKKRRAVPPSDVPPMFVIRTAIIDSAHE